MLWNHLFQQTRAKRGMIRFMSQKAVFTTITDALISLLGSPCLHFQHPSCPEFNRESRRIRSNVQLLLASKCCTDQQSLKMDWKMNKYMKTSTCLCAIETKKHTQWEEREEGEEWCQLGGKGGGCPGLIPFPAPPFSVPPLRPPSYQLQADQ